MPALNQQILRGEMRLDEPLSRHTSWRVGGPARCFYRPADREDLVLFLRQLDADEPLHWLGLGSNLLVRDGGINGTVIATKGTLAGCEWRSEKTLYVEAGVSCAKVARMAARAGLCGVEFLAGIPGTLGGALAMNAGAFGGETWERVRWVETVDRYGEVRRRVPTDFTIGYRHVTGPTGEWFLSAELALETGDTVAAQQQIKQLLERRAATQPTSQPSCGSVFRNPPGDYAARLIEAAGLKGKQIGGAQVSQKHANFIINTGAATADDIERLISEVQQEVEKQSGIVLVTEVHRIGESS
ncbi:MAG: UDP-N-acetylmuramate dehydrogenase [Candidatus Thiodiazotropha sp. (ex Codakia rugifera)]|nr:UDP-N-acetylmuramate dehydrogenase [Candidatus Thiodiazotropha sp. (ex Codakia rugifera)]